MVNNKEILEQLHWRYAVKKFDPSKKISGEDWETLEEALRLSPSSYGLQPWKFLVVQSPEIRKKLSAASGGQQQIENASHLVVLTHLKTMTEEYVARYTQVVAQQQGIPVEKLQGLNNMIVGDLVKGPRAATFPHWAARQTYIAMGTFLTTAALLHIDTCPMEGLNADQYDEILDLKNTEYQTVAGITAGYRAADDKYQHMPKVRFAKEEVIRVV